MSDHEYTAEEALELLLRKLQISDAELAAQVRAAIDAGKDIEEEEKPRRLRRKKARRYRKTVRLSTTEALAVATDVLQAYFIEQALFVASAMDNTRLAALDGPRNIDEPLGAQRVAKATDNGWDVEKILEIELRGETQLTPSGDETYRLERPDQLQVAQQRENLSRLRSMLLFRSE